MYVYMSHANLNQYTPTSLSQNFLNQRRHCQRARTSCYRYHLTVICTFITRSQETACSKSRDLQSDYIKPVMVGHFLGCACLWGLKIYLPRGWFIFQRAALEIHRVCFRDGRNEILSRLGSPTLETHLAPVRGGPDGTKISVLELQLSQAA